MMKSSNENARKSFLINFRIMAAQIVLAAAIISLTIHGAEAEPFQRRTPVVEAVEKVGPAVVNISTTIKERLKPGFPFSSDDFFRDFFPDFFTREYTRSSLGSGIIIDGKKGRIVTNHHVVARAAEIKVITADQREYQARILGSDPRSDLAVLKIEPEKPLPEIHMGDSEDLMIGETVIAIGNPFGLSHTVTTGVVSAIDRTVRSGEMVYRHFIQTDASINPGNSGGPLLNINGDLIGINTAIYQKAEGIGFAIPVNKAKRIVNELIRSGEVRFPWMGLEVQELTADLKSHFKLPEAMEGVLVNNIMENSPAHKSGVKRGDILLSLGREKIASISDYRGALAEYTPGSNVELKLFRDGKEINTEANLSPFPPDLAVQLVAQRLGMDVDNAGRRITRRYGVQGAVAITAVRRGSEASRVGLEKGDLILKINGINTRDLDTFKMAISRYHQLPALTFYIGRGGYIYSLTLPF
jgi:Do/DeqQ family serine protease